MKLGGITWWRYNYGSILQAYALQTKLNSYQDVDYEIICQYGKKVASAKNLSEKLNRLGFKKTFLRALCKFGLKKLRMRNRNIERFVESHLQISKDEFTESNIGLANEVYDGFICGSDQIWNPELTELDSIYWLKFTVPGKLKISYAPSVGVDHFTTEQQRCVRENLADFKAVSAREEQGTKIINDALGKETCITVLDPTLIIDKSEWDKLSEGKLYKEPYIFAYILRGSVEERKYIERFATARKLKIVTMPFLDPDHICLYDFNFGDIKLWDGDPSDFIRAIRYADYVFTDSFHSLVFSCIYHREFYVFPKIGKAQLNRVLELLHLVEAEDRLLDLNRDKERNASLTNKINWDKVDKKIDEKKILSSRFLEDALLNR
ncbi:MAG: polysaccharide pyruvyl transferase family protein [Clostridia bacterium]|nr:polysaccharide pyruvyl transferase family protein [Clostridia bacterium]